MTTTHYTTSSHSPAFLGLLLWLQRWRPIGCGCGAHDCPLERLDRSLDFWDEARVLEEDAATIDADMAAVWGLPVSVYDPRATERDARRLGVLGFYLKGRPLPAAAHVVLEERELAGEWGSVLEVAGAASRIDVFNPSRAWHWTLGRLRRLLELTHYSGPVTVWIRFGLGDPFVDGVSCAWSSPWVTAALGLSAEPSFTFAQIAEGVAAEPFGAGWCVAHRLGGNAIAAGDALAKGEWCLAMPGAGAFPVVDVLAHRKLLAEARGEALARARRLDAPGSRLRADAFEWLPRWLRKWERTGWIGG